MRPIFKKIVLGAMVCTLPLLLSGCFLRLLFGTVGERDTDFGIVFIATIGGTFGPLAICDFDPETGNLVNCDYSFFDPEVGEFVRTSSAELISEFGLFGVFIDPLILQIPAGATNFSGTIDDGSGPQPIVVTEVSSFNAQPGTEVSAEAGQKFVILEFPAHVISALQSSGTLSGPFDFNFEFELPSLSPVDVKAMYTGKVEVNGQTFFPPMLPCVTDFADVPAITIPVSQNSVNLMPQVFGIVFPNPTLACDHAVYDFTSGGPQPSPEVALDIKPGSCPNPLNTGSQGVLLVAILGAADFDVNDIGPSSVQLEGVSPLRSAVEDVSAPVANTQGGCDCANNDPDGFDDLTLKFDTQEIVAALGPVNDGDEVTLILTATLFDGTNIEGKDCVVINSTHKIAASKSDENLPQSYKLNQNYPNPFSQIPRFAGNPGTQITFTVPEAGEVELIIYNLNGQFIKALYSGPIAAGRHSVHWDGTDHSGNSVPSGIYFYKLSAGKDVFKVKKMSWIR